MERSWGDQEVARQVPLTAVLDSSVVVKWFSEEEKTQEALALRDRHIEGDAELWIAGLSLYEVSNALRYKPGFTRKKLAESVHSLFNLHLNIERANRRLLTESSAIAYTCDVTIYDAVPVALAKVREISCITADSQTQYSRIKAKGYPIELL